MDRLIFHIDVNSAYLSWEAVLRIAGKDREIDLRKIPSAVGGDIQKRKGVILAKSIPAKKYGIKTGETIQEALKKCPELMVIPPHHSLYAEYSSAFFEILNRFVPVIEKSSIDEAYCDMTGTECLYGTPIASANLIKDTIYKELGFTVNIGISNNKLLAKMASDFKKPNLVHTLFPSEIKSKMWVLPVSKLFFVGSSSTHKLLQLGIRTIGELANSDPSLLRSHFKKHGEIIHLFANGIDPSDVTGTPADNKSYGNSATVPQDILKKEEARLLLLSLCESICIRLRTDSVKINVVCIGITYFDFSHASHQATLFSATNTTAEVYQTACSLFDEMWNGIAIRKISVNTKNPLEDDGMNQLNLFNLNTFDKQAKLDHTMDKIRQKYGKDAIMRASFLNNSSYHMSVNSSPDRKSMNQADGNHE